MERVEGSHGGFYRRTQKGANTWGIPRVVGQHSGYLPHEMLPSIGVWVSILFFIFKYFEARSI